MANGTNKTTYSEKKDDEEVLFDCRLVHRDCAEGPSSSFVCNFPHKTYRKIGWLSMDKLELESNVVPILACTPFTNDETITCLTGNTSDLFIGSSLGNVFHVKNTQSGFQFFGITHAGDGPVVQAEFLSAQESLLVLVNQKLEELSVASSNYFSIISIINNVSKFAINKYPIYREDADPFCVQIAIAFNNNNQIQVFEKLPEKQMRKPFHKVASSDSVVDLAFAGNFICFATKNHYFRHDIKKNDTCRQCETFTSVKKDDGSLPSTDEERQKNTLICTVSPNRFVLFRTANSLVSNVDMENGVLKYHDACVLSACSKGTDVYVVSNHKITIYGDDSQISCFLPNDNKYELIANLEGQILICNGNQVFQTRKHSPMAKISSLVEMGLYEQALLIAQEESRVVQNEEIMRAIQSLKRAIGFAKLKEKKECVLAFNYLLEAEVDPMEVISNIEKESILTYQYLSKMDMDPPRQLSNLVSSLREYLIEVKKLDFVNDEQRKMIDLEQIKFQFHSDIEKWNDEYDKLVDENLDPVTERHVWRQAAAIAIQKMNIDEVLSCWTRALPDVLLEEVEDALKIFKDERRSKAVMEWVMLNTPHHAIEVIDKHLSPLFSLVERSAFLQTHPEIHKAWLSQHLEDSFVSREKYLEIWCDTARNSSIDDESFKGFRRALLKFPEKKLEIDEKTRLFLQNPNFLLEQQLVKSKPTQIDAETVISTLLSQNDYETAEAYLKLHFEQYPELTVFFFDYYRKIGPTNYADKLKEYINSTDDSRVMGKLLDLESNIKLEEITELLNAKLMTRGNDFVNSYVVKCCQAVAVSQNKQRKANKAIRIEENGKCEVCFKEFDLSIDRISYLPTGCIVHSSCIRHPGLCPVTNGVFAP